ncbi:hypothetical protein AD953_09060 [Acetobacter malorum]|uniref:NYN domain-containing protein n=1 Tax=Acetobacter malorum TaxID=178901 RepID=A0A149V4E4_9PROT|nr:NYN domain-containing protein [Acetobacter malorum]KXV75068.1 hypothetical protein AD953_09060 [Acetobacter malorum]
MKKKTIILIDGGHLRVLSKQVRKNYNPDFIEKAAMGCINEDEDLIRALYYDCPQYSGKVRLPVSGDEKIFEADNNWLRQIGKKDYFAVRQGVLKFRGFKPRATPVSPQELTDDDFQPIFEQKGVDMRIGLDIANYSDQKAVDRFIIITADTDCIPAFKHARKAGIQVVLAKFPNSRFAREIGQHTDFIRDVDYPSGFDVCN